MPATARCYRWTLTDTAIGPALIVASEAGVCEIRLRPTMRHHPPDDPRYARDDVGLAEIADAVRGLIDGTRRDFPFPLDMARGTDFQRRCWEELRRVPWGETATYGEIAEKIGRPHSPRAVGQSCARNPLPIVVPCHRILSAGGRLGGFTGGLDIKRHLLAVEGATGTW